MDKRLYKSCFVTDVCIEKNKILLTDSCQREYVILASNQECIKQFEDWFKKVFSKGVAQTCTIFQYENVQISECEIESHIIRFISSEK